MITRDDIIFFDLESKGLSVNDDFLCAVISNWRGKEFVTEDLNDLHKKIFDLKKKYDYIATYNGDNFRGGYDLPYLRSKFVMEGIPYPFGGINHLDLLPIVDKYIWTKQNKNTPPSKSNLSADDVRVIAKANDVEYDTKNKTYATLRKMWDEIEDCDWCGYDKEKVKENNSLNEVYKIFFDPNEEEEYMDGEDCVDMPMEDVIRHCKQDITKTKYIFDFIIEIAPPYIIEKNTIQL